MLNILKMNLFRMKFSRILIVMLAVVIGISLLFFGLDWLIAFSMEDLVGGVNGMPQADPGTHNAWGIVRNTMGYGAIPLGAVMAMLLFFFFDVSTGYVKNLVGYETDKYRLVCADMLAAGAYTAVLMLSTTVVLSLLTCAAYRNLEYDGFGKFLVWLLVSYLEVMAYFMLFKAWSDASRRGIGLMIIGGIYPILAMSLYAMIDLAVILIFENETFAIEKYTLLGGLSAYSLSGKWGDLVPLTLIATAVFAAGFFLDVLALRKREL